MHRAVGGIENNLKLLYFKSMDKRKNRKYSNNWNNQNRKNNNHSNSNHNNHNNSFHKEKTFQFNHTLYQNDELEKERQNTITEIHSREVKCAVCGELISDIFSAISDKLTGKPVHFECVIKKIEGEENLQENEKIAYIGQGRFGVLSYENIRDQKNFKIKKIIEVEDRENKADWRTEISESYSKIN